MDNLLRNNSEFADADKFEENENDSDLEGRLYAEIYFSNEIHETGDTFEDDGMQTIEDIKKASRCVTPSASESRTNQTSDSMPNSSTPGKNNITKNQNPKNDLTVSKSLRNEQFSPGVDNNLNLEKQVNLEVETDNIPATVPSEIINENLQLQQKKVVTQKNISDYPNSSKKKKKSVESPQLSSSFLTTNSVKRKSKVDNEYENINNFSEKVDSLKTPKSGKRKSKADKEYENKSKKSSVYNRNTDDNLGKIQLNPVNLNYNKSRNENNHFPPISDGAMEILFPTGWKDNFENVSKKSKVRKKRASKLNKQNAKEKENQELNNKTEQVVEIISLDSEDDSDVVITETPKKEKRKNLTKNRNQVPVSLEISSDSSESIFEVPVPPKPAPPCVKVKDSDAESSDESSSDGIYDINSPSYKEKQIKATGTPKSEKTSDDSEEEKQEVKSFQSSATIVLKKRIKSSRNSISKKLKMSPENSSPISINSTSTEDENSCISEVRTSCTVESEKEDDSIGDDLILNCSANMPELEGSECNEYFEPLNDTNEDINQEPSTVNKNGKLKKTKEKNQKTSKEKTDVEYYFAPMPDKIRAYYNNSWGGENYSIQEVQKKMSKNPKHWAILDEDKPSSRKRQRYFLDKIKCTLCRQSGHVRANCTEKKKSPVCHMCGSQGHYETRCPHKICLTCGKKQHSYRKTCESCNKMNCKSCNSRGHTEENCPDHWRRYHNTTTEMEYISPRDYKEVMKPSHLLVCCNCTGRGHDSYNCPKYRWSQHYPTPSHVRDYNVHDYMAPGPSRNREEETRMSQSRASDQSSSRYESNAENQNHQKSTVNRNFDNRAEDRDFDNRGEQQNFHNTTERQNYQVKNHNSTSNVLDNLNTVKVLFDCRLLKRLKPQHSKKFNMISTETIVLNDIKDAKLQTLIDRRCDLDFLKFLSPILKCEFSITMYDGWKIVMKIKYFVPFHSKSFLRRIIQIWVQIIEREKVHLCFTKLPPTKTPLLLCFSKRYQVLSESKFGIETRVENLKARCQELKERIGSPGFDPSYCIRYIRSTVCFLSALLCEQGCGTDENDYLGFQETLNTVQKGKKHVGVDNYMRLFFYYQMLFPRFTPPDFTEMINKYYVKTGNPNRVSFEDIFVTIDVQESRFSRDNYKIDEFVNISGQENEENPRPEPVLKPDELVSQPNEQFSRNEHISKSEEHASRGNEPGNEHGNEPGNEHGNEHGNEPGNEHGNEHGSEPGNDDGLDYAKDYEVDEKYRFTDLPSSSKIDSGEPQNANNSNVFSNPAKDFIPLHGNDHFQRTHWKRNQRKYNKRSQSINTQGSHDYTQDSHDYTEDSYDYDQGSSTYIEGRNECDDEIDNFTNYGGIPIYSSEGFPTGQFKRSDGRNERTHARLKKDATFYMRKALNLNVPEITQAAIRLGNMINERTVYRKHIDYLKMLMKRYRKQSTRLMRKEMKKEKIVNEAKRTAP